MRLRRVSLLDGSIEEKILGAAHAILSDQEGIDGALNAAALTVC
jgi:hypothetical protein